MRPAAVRLGEIWVGGGDWGLGSLKRAGAKTCIPPGGLRGEHELARGGQPRGESFGSSVAPGPTQCAPPSLVAPPPPLALACVPSRVTGAMNKPDDFDHWRMPDDDSVKKYDDARQPAHAATSDIPARRATLSPPRQTLTVCAAPPPDSAGCRSSRTPRCQTRQRW